MGDSTSAELFGEIFCLLEAEMRAHPGEEERYKRVAAEMWKKSRGYDFTPDEMGCEEVMVALDLAEEVDVDERHGLGTFYYYGPPGQRS